LVGVSVGGDGELDYNAFAFEGVVVVIYSAFGGAASLELEVCWMNGSLFFDGCGDDSGGWVDSVWRLWWWFAWTYIRLGEDVVVDGVDIVDDSGGVGAGCVKCCPSGANRGLDVVVG